MELTSITPDATQLKALTHPVRLRMLGLLRAEGPATATTLAARLGLNTGATSYHLRQLATHGFVVDDEEPHGNRRERWWRAAHRSTEADLAAATTPTERDAVEAFLQAVATGHTELLQRSMEEREQVPLAWREASTLSDWSLRLTPARARRLVEALERLVDETDEVDEGEEGEEQAGDFLVMLHAFPRPSDRPPDRRPRRPT